MTVHGAYVYWNDNDGNVRRVPKTGGTVQIVASGQDKPRLMASDATSIYWANQGTTPGTGSVKRLAVF